MLVLTTMMVALIRWGTCLDDDLKWKLASHVE